jgi:hypothetical protein
VHWINLSHKIAYILELVDPRHNFVEDVTKYNNCAVASRVLPLFVLALLLFVIGGSQDLIQDNQFVGLLQSDFFRGFRTK